jgi:hypothetical protein
MHTNIATKRIGKDITATEVSDTGSVGLGESPSVGVGCSCEVCDGGSNDGDGEGSISAGCVGDCAVGDAPDSVNGQATLIPGSYV